MRWSRVGAHSVVELRVALLNQEFHELARRSVDWTATCYVALAENIPRFLTASTASINCERQQRYCRVAENELEGCHGTFSGRRSSHEHADSTLDLVRDIGGQ